MNLPAILNKREQRVLSYFQFSTVHFRVGTLMNAENADFCFLTQSRRGAKKIEGDAQKFPHETGKGVVSF